MEVGEREAIEPHLDGEGRAIPTSDMKLFIAGAPCSGKTTLVRLLRNVHGLNAVDMDDEILRFNGGTWPDIETKNKVVKPAAMKHVLAMPEVVLFCSYMSPDHLRQLRSSGFTIVLMEVTEAELRRRDANRLEEEGWSNIEWFEWNQAALREIRESGFVDEVISGERTPAAIAEEILTIAATLETALEEG